MSRTGRSAAAGHARPGAPALLAAGTLLLLSCAAMPRVRLQVYLADTPPGHGSWTVAGIEVDHRTAADQIRAMLDDLLLPVSRGSGLPLGEGAGGEFALEVRVVEREISRGLDMLNAMSVTLTVREAASGRVAATAVYGEESQESLASLYHMHAVLSRLMEALSRELRVRSSGRRTGRAGTA
jgi:hypothetical protein